MLHWERTDHSGVVLTLDVPSVLCEGMCACVAQALRSVTSILHVAIVLCDVVLTLFTLLLAGDVRVDDAVNMFIWRHDPMEYLK